MTSCTKKDLDKDFIVIGILQTASLAEWTACLTTDHEVASSIPSTSTILKVDQV